MGAEASTDGGAPQGNGTPQANGPPLVEQENLVPTNATSDVRRQTSPGGSMLVSIPESPKESPRQPFAAAPKGSRAVSSVASNMGDAGSVADLDDIAEEVDIGESQCGWVSESSVASDNEDGAPPGYRKESGSADDSEKEDGEPAPLTLTLSSLAESAGSSSGSVPPGFEGMPMAQSERHADFLKRRAERKASRSKRQQANSMKSGFLSALPEVKADIAYRFCFTVNGVAAQRAMEAACGNEAAEDNALPPSPNNSRIGSFGQKKDKTLKCFSRVPFPVGAEREFTTTGRLDPMKFSSEVPKLCKLIFNPKDKKSGSPWDIAMCTTRTEALSSALVYILVIDPAEGEPTFHEQLLEYERMVDQIRFSRSQLRPARAIMLCRNNGSPEDPLPAPPPGHMPWDRRLQEFEMCYDGSALWKFGPVSLSDSIGIHAVFSTIASKRIMRGQESQGEDSDGSQQSDAPQCYDAERDSMYERGSTDASGPEWLNNASDASDAENQPGPLALRPSPEEDGGSPLGRSRFSGGRQHWMSAMEKGAA